MAGSRSKKSGGQYDGPKKQKYVPIPGVIHTEERLRKAKDLGLGSGMADSAKKKIKEAKKRRFPDPNDY